MQHETRADYTCPTCGWVVRPQIAHECNYMLCHKCRGIGTTGWRDTETCDECGGTGKWTNKPEEENPEGVRA